MAIKYVHDDLLDLALAGLEAADKLVICEDTPVSYANATTDKGSGGMALGEVAVDSGDFTKAAGDASGRKTTIAQQVGVIADVTGAWDCIALVDDGTSKLLAVQPMANSAITGVNTGTKTFTIDGDHTGDIAAADTVTVRDSTGNDATYTVASRSLNGSDTDVVVNEAISDATVDGTMIYGAQAVTSGNTVTVNATDIEFTDPS